MATSALDDPLAAIDFTLGTNEPEQVDADFKVGKRQCIAIRSIGIRCRRPPIRGGKVCILHGGGTPMAKLGAQRMLLSTVEPALATLVAALGLECEPMEGMTGWCSVHGFSCPEWSVRISAAKTLLDRAGLPTTQNINLDKPAEDLSKVPLDKLADELAQLATAARAEAAFRAAAIRMNEDDPPMADAANPSATH